MVALLALLVGAAAAIAVHDAMSLRSGAAQARAAVAAGDYQAAVAAFEASRPNAARLDGLLSSPALTWTGDLPVVGPTVVAAREIVSAANSVLTASAPLEPALDAAASGDPVVALGAIQAADSDLQRLADAAASASQQVAGIDSEPVLSPLQPAVRKAQALLVGAFDDAAAGAAVSRALPAMVGIGEPARWLVVLAQPSEARGSGSGFNGAYLTLTASNGDFEFGEAASNDAEMNVVHDLSALPEEYRTLWGSDTKYIWGFNMSRHYPYAASLARQALDPAADYVVSLDPRTVAGLIAISGPVVVDGVTIDADNAERFFTRDIYVRYPDPKEKDRVTMQALQEVFVGLGSVGKGSPQQWMAALGDPVLAGHVQVWSPNAPAQAALEGSVLGGAVPDEPAPWATVAFNNAGGNKIDSYVSTSVEYAATGQCSAESVSGTLTTQLAIDRIRPGLPPYISGRSDRTDAPYGTTAMMVHLYAPVGAQGVGSVLVNGAPVPAAAGTERGHPVWGVKVELAPDAPVTVQLHFTQPAYPGRPLVVAPQPMVRDTKVTVADQRSCATIGSWR